MYDANLTSLTSSRTMKNFYSLPLLINRKYTAKVGQDNVDIGVVTIFRLANTSLLQVYLKPHQQIHGSFFLLCPTLSSLFF